MESRVSVYGITEGVWHHRRCMASPKVHFLRLDYIHPFGMIPYATSSQFHGAVANKVLQQPQSCKKIGEVTKKMGIRLEKQKRLEKEYDKKRMAKNPRKKCEISRFAAWEIYAAFVFRGNRSCPNLPLSSRLQSFWILKAKESRKNCVSTLLLPRVRKRRKR